jgi:sugar lactone lactonase YvrE
VRGHLRVLLAVAALTSFFAFATSASATYVNSGTFAGPGAGSGDGQLTTPGRAAVEQGSGNLFVVDSGNGRVQVFKPNAGGTADYLTQFGSGALSAPWGIAIDENAGQTFVYVADAGNDRIVKYASDEAATPTFSIDGTFTSPAKGAGSGQVGDFKVALAVDPTSHDLLVADTANDRIDRFNFDGSADGSFDGSAGSGSPGAFAGPIDVAVNSTGDVYVIDATGDIANRAGTSKALRYSGAGEYNATLGPVGTHQRVATVAVNPTTDEVVVSGDQDNVYEDGPPPFVPIVQVFDSANGSLPTGEVALSAQYDTVSGLAFAGGLSPRFYAVLDVGTYLGTPYGDPQIQTFESDGIESAVVTLAPPVVAGNSAHLSGTVNPEGTAASYQFEFQIDGEAGWTVAPGSPGDAGSGTAPVAVEADLDGLNPSTAYNVRLTATNGAGLAGSPVQTFTTDLAAPGIKSIQVSPLNTYHVEYGATGAYGSSTPEIAVAAATVAVPIQVKLTGLKPGSLYHFRLVLKNSVGTTTGLDQTFSTLSPAGGIDSCPNAAIRGEQHSSYLPNCRAYEQVTPTDKNGAEPFSKAGLRVVSASGERAVFSAFVSLGGSAASPSVVTYLARRQATGWETEGITPPHAVEQAFKTGLGIYSTFTDELTRGAVNNDRPDLTPGAPPGVENLYLRELDAGTYSLVTTAGPAPDLDYFPSFADTSPDLRTILFEATAALTPDAPSGVMNLYRWRDGQIDFVGILPDGSPAAAGSTSGSLPTYENFTGTVERNTVSPDGELIVFGDRGSGQLYLREGSVATREISKSVRATADPNGRQPASFKGATPSLSKVFFTSGEKLTDDATTGADSHGSDLYAFDTQTGGLTDLSVDVNPADPDGANVLGILGASDSGDRVYFVAKGQIEPGKGTAGQPNVYVWTPTETRYVMTLRFPGVQENGDAAYWSPVPAPNQAVSADGMRLYLSSGGGATGYSTGGFKQVFLYDFAADELTCVSCPQDGSTPVGGASTKLMEGGGDSMQQSRSMTESGDRYYFESPDALVPTDTNGTTDVYQFENGKLSLISSGQDSFPSRFFGISGDGDDVLFLTKERLLDSDRDEAGDIYSARVGGGFRQSSAIAPCVDDGCQGVLRPPPTAPAVGSAQFQGAGNPKRAKHKPAKCAKKPKQGKKRCGKAPKRSSQGKKTTKSRGAK